MGGAHRFAPFAHCAVLMAGLAAVVGCSRPHEGETPPVAPWLGLQAGPYAVGYTVDHRYDHTRSFRPKYDLDGQPVSGEIARPIQISIWYPAQPGMRPVHMQYGEYLRWTASQFDFTRIGEVPSEQSIAHARERLIERGADPTRVDDVLRRRSLVVKGAAPFPGRFPLVVYGAGYEAPAWENAVLLEYLASYGYVIASSPSFGMYSPGMTNDLMGLEAKTRDHEFVMARAREFVNADSRRIAALGWCFGGLSTVVFALRNSHVDAVVSLDGSMAYDEYEDAALASPHYHLENLRVPFMYLAQAPVDLQDLGFFDELKYSDAYLLTFHDLTHYDFSASHILSEVQAFENGRGRDVRRINLGYAVVCRYVRRFLDAYLKGDATAVSFLACPPEANNIPDNVVSIARRRGLPPPPSSDQFFSLIQSNDVEEAFELFRHARRTAPEVQLFSEELIGPLGRDLLKQGRFDDAIRVFQMQVLAYPESWKGYSALAGAYLHAGRRELAAANYRKSLELNPDNEPATAFLSKSQGEPGPPLDTSGR